MHRVKYILLAILLHFFELSYTQIQHPNFNFQAIARDHFDHPVSSKQIKIKMQLLAEKTSTDILYEEIHDVITDEIGVFSISVGNGIFSSGKYSSLSDMDWSMKQFYIKCSIAVISDVSFGEHIINYDWVELGVTQLGVVPYAMYALKSYVGDDTILLKTKLNSIDTSKMLLPYALKEDLKNMNSQIKSNLSIADTSLMLSTYAKKEWVLQNINAKLNQSDSVNLYVTPTMLQSYKFDTTFLTLAINQKFNITDTASILNGYLRKGSVVSFPGTIDYDSLLHRPFLFDGNYNNLTHLPILFSGNYSDLSNRPILFDGDYANLTNKPSLFSGNYTDLSNLPLLFDGDYFNLTNKPSLFSGSYTDLLNKPVLFDGNYNSLNNKPNLFSGNYADLILPPDLTLKESVSNKSNDIVIDALSNTKYPSVNAVKTYVDATILAGAPDADVSTKGIIKLAGDLSGSATVPRIANNSIVTDKILDGAVTDAKLASGISASKVGLGNVSNHAQLYSFNGLTAQVQTLNVPSTLGTAPNWVSNTNTHTLNIPLASTNNVTAGLISKADYDRFDVSSNTRIESITTVGTSGTASLTSHTLNIPNYTLEGLSGLVAANTFFAGPTSGANASPSFRSMVSGDIPDNNANTTGNATTATTLLNARNINGVSFNGSTDISITANTPNALQFDASGAGDVPSVNFNGAASKTISYNSIGAAPANGSSNISTLGTISNGIWHGTVIGSNYGGAGTINGILKANGSGVVSLATSNTDYQLPISVSLPLQFSSNNLSMNQSSSSNSGYLSSADWNSFNNKINASEKGMANGVANLDANGKIATSMIPAISFSTGVVVNSQAEMLNLSSAVTGTIAIRTDNNNNYVLSATPASILANWIQLAMPTSVQTINGITGVNINLTTNNITEGSNNKYFSNTLSRNALSALAPLIYDASTGVFSITASGNSSSGYLTSTDWNTFNNKLGAFGTQSQNVVYAAPDGTNGLPSFRSLVANDIPVLNQNTTGTAANITASSNGTLQSISSLSTIGTINTGVWHGSIISPQYGGTGINNGTKTISLGGNLTTAGAFTTSGNYSVTMAALGNTNINLPVSGTLATISGVEAFTNKTINGISFSSNATGFAISGGNTNVKTITLTDNASVAGTNTGDQTISLNGDITGTGTGTFSTTLASTGVVAGTYGAANKIPSFVVDAKGRITSASETSLNNLTLSSLSLTNGNIIVGDVNNVASSVAMSGDVSVSNTGVASIGNNKVTNTMLLGGIASSKLIGTDINSVGTITSGTWNAGLIGGQYGGTGINNGNKTISLGGNLTTANTLTFAGNYTSTLTMTGNTSVTFPTSGTLATLAGTETLSNKTLTSPILTTPNIGAATATSITSGTITSTSDITAKRFVLTNNSISSNTTTAMDLSAGNVITINMTGNITTLNINNPSIGTYLIKFVQDATGSRTITFPSAWKWAGGIIPLLTTTAYKLDIVTLIYDGTNYYATIVQNF